MLTAPPHEAMMPGIARPLTQRSNGCMNAFTKLLSLTALTSLAACAAGPQQLQRSVDDWDRELYVQKPLLDGVLYVIPVIPLVKFGAAVGDVLVINPYHFWLEDVWDGKGTNFEHAEVESTDGELQSLMIDGAEVLKKN